MSYLVATLRAVGWVAAGFVFLGIGLALQLPVFTVSRRHRLTAHFTRWWARASCFFFNIRFKVVGELNPDPGALIVSNHVGTPDIFILGSCFKAFFVSKAEIADWPAFNWLARVGATIFADRTKRHQVKSIISEIRKRLDDNCSVIMFPEARATEGQDVIPFKSAIFESAILSRRPVIPVSIIYHDRNTPSVACWYNMTFIKHITALLQYPRLEATVVILPEIREETDRRALAQKSHDAIRQKYLSEKDREN